MFLALSGQATLAGTDAAFGAAFPYGDEGSLKAEESQIHVLRDRISES